MRSSRSPAAQLPVTQISLSPFNLFSFVHNSFHLFCFLTGAELVWPSTKESGKPVQARAEEWTWCGEFCRGIHRDGSCLLSSEYASKHRPPVPGQPSKPSKHCVVRKYINTLLILCDFKNYLFFSLKADQSKWIFLLCFRATPLLLHPSCSIRTQSWEIL